MGTLFLKGKVWAASTKNKWIIMLVSSETRSFDTIERKNTHKLDEVK